MSNLFEIFGVRREWTEKPRGGLPLLSEVFEINEEPLDIKGDFSSIDPGGSEDAIPDDEGQDGPTGGLPGKGPPPPGPAMPGMPGMGGAPPAPPEEGETFEDWMERVTGQRPPPGMFPPPPGNDMPESVSHLAGMLLGEAEEDDFLADYPEQPDTGQSTADRFSRILGHGEQPPMSGIEPVPEPEDPFADQGEEPEVDDMLGAAPDEVDVTPGGAHQAKFGVDRPPPGGPNQPPTPEQWKEFAAGPRPAWLPAHVPWPPPMDPDMKTKPVQPVQKTQQIGAKGK